MILASCLWLIVLGLNFVALAIVADDYLAPSLDVIAKRLKIPHNVAAASFLAFGSAVPEIMTSIVSTVKGKVDVSLPAILGSGCIAYAVIGPACVFVIQPMYQSRKQRERTHGVGVTKNQEVALNLHMKPLLRDVGIYTFSLLLTLYFISDGDVQLYESVTLVTLYVLYLSSLYYWSDYWSTAENEEINETTPLQADTTKGDTETGGAGEVHESDKSENNTQEEEGAETCLDKTIDFIRSPFEFIFSWTIPPCDAESSWYVVTFFISMGYVAVLSSTTLKITTQLSYNMDLTHELAGVTLVAVGAEVPDTIASMAVAKLGEGPSAVSNALNSQIINLLVGLGVPYMIRSAIIGKGMNLGSGGDTQVFIGSCLGLLVMSFIFFVFRNVWMDGAKHPALSLTSSKILLTFYGAVVIGLFFWTYI
jgi:Ca2+/Na+ antiporter